MFAAPAMGAGEDSTLTSAPRKWRHAAGVSAGMPQVIAFTWEFEPKAPFRLQANAGGVLILNSLSIRGLLVPMIDKISPYAFMGGGIIFGTNEDDWDGFSPYAWFGVGLRVPMQHVTGFVELSGVEYSDDPFGSPTGAVGILWQY
jgi:hypothetical protein